MITTTALKGCYYKQSHFLGNYSAYYLLLFLLFTLALLGVNLPGDLFSEFQNSETPTTSLPG
jgi:hypothetical protein